MHSIYFVYIYYARPSGTCTAPTRAPVDSACRGDVNAVRWDGWGAALLAFDPRFEIVGEAVKVASKADEPHFGDEGRRVDQFLEGDVA